MYEPAVDLGIAFTAIGIVTPDPASVESVLSWAKALQNKVQYVIVENEPVQHADLNYWRNTEQARQFCRIFNPATISMKFRLPDLENAARQHGVSLGEVASRRVTVVELRKSSLVARAQGYLRQLYQELDKIQEVFLV